MESTTLATKLAAFVLLTVVAVGTIQRILRNAARGKDIHFPLVQPHSHYLEESPLLTLSRFG